MYTQRIFLARLEHVSTYTCLGAAFKLCGSLPSPQSSTTQPDGKCEDAVGCWSIPLVAKCVSEFYSNRQAARGSPQGVDLAWKLTLDFVEASESVIPRPLEQTCLRLDQPNTAFRKTSYGVV